MRRRSWRLFAAVLAAFCVFACAAAVLAEGAPRLNPQLGSPGGAGEGLQGLPSEWGVGVPGEPTSPPRPRTGGSLLEELLTLPLQGIFGALKGMGVKTVYDLVFENTLVSGKAVERGIFTEEQWQAVNGFRRVFVAVAWLLLVISLVVAGVEIAAGGPSLQKRGRLTGMALDFLGAVLLLGFMPLFFDWVCDLNAGLVETVKRAVPVDLLRNTLDPENVWTGSVILDWLVKIAWITLQLWFNVLYWVRLFVVGVLYVISPLIAWAFSMRATKTPFFLAMSEMVSNVFMQGAHAVVLGFWALLIQATPTLARGAAKATLKDVYSTWWVFMGAMVIIIPVAGLVRNLVCGWMNLLGVKEEQIAGAATLGLGGLVGLGGLAQALAGVAISGLVGPRVSRGSVALAPPTGGVPPGWQPVARFVPPGGPAGGGGGGAATGPGPAAGPAPGGAAASGPAPVVTAGARPAGGGGLAAAGRAAGAGVALAGAAGRAAGSAASHAASYPVGAQPAGGAAADVGEAAASAAAARLLRRGEGSGAASSSAGGGSGSGRAGSGADRQAARGSAVAAAAARPSVGLSADGLDGYLHGPVPSVFPRV